MSSMYDETLNMVNAQMAKTIDQLRANLNAMETELAALREREQLANKLFEVVYALYLSTEREDWLNLEPAMLAYGRSIGEIEADE